MLSKAWGNFWESWAFHEKFGVISPFLWGFGRSFNYFGKLFGYLLVRICRNIATLSPECLCYNYNSDSHSWDSSTARKSPVLFTPPPQTRPEQLREWIQQLQHLPALRSGPLHLLHLRHREQRVRVIRYCRPVNRILLIRSHYWNPETYILMIIVFKNKFKSMMLLSTTK